MFGKVKKVVLFAGFAFLLTVLVYLPSVRYDFITYDDLVYVLQNEHMHQGLTWQDVQWAFTSRTYASNWHPLTWLSMMADVSLGQGKRLSPEAWMQTGNCISKIMHAHNVLLHATNAALLFVVAFLLCKGRLDEKWLLVFVLLWSLHPLRTEVVCWASERKEVLCVFFMLLSILSYLKNRFWTSLGCCILAMLAKPVAVTLPVVLFAYDFAICGRRRLGRMVPFFLASAITSLMTIGAQTVAIDCGTAQGSASRLNSMFGAPIVYLRQTFWPAGLSAVYAAKSSPDWILIGLGIILVTILTLVVRTWFRKRFLGNGKETEILDILVFAIAWVYIGLTPMLGIVKVGWQEHSDRYTYWIGCGACVGVTMLLAAKGVKWWRTLVAWVETIDGRPVDVHRAKNIVFISICCIVGGLAILTYQRMPVWSGPVPFLRDSIQKSWSLDFASVMSKTFRNYGPEYVNEAEYWLRQCATKKPGAEADIVLAEFLIWKGADGEAEMLLEGALRTDPHQKAANGLMKRLRDRKTGAGTTTPHPSD